MPTSTKIPFKIFPSLLGMTECFAVSYSVLDLGKCHISRMLGKMNY